MSSQQNAPRPEHRTHSIHDDGVTDLGGGDPPVEFRCGCSRPFGTRPVRLDTDPETVVRCAQCGKKHSTDSLEIPFSDRP